MKTLLSFSVWIVLSVSGILCNASGKLPPEIDKRVSALTVLVKVETKSGIIPVTGFVFKQIGDDVYILSKAGIFETEKKAEITFYSGSSKEKTVTGNLISRSERYHMAVIKVHAPFFKEPGFKESSAKFHRTMQLYIVRFNFGLKPAGSNKGPAPTIIPSSIAGLHKNQDGSLKYIRLDAEIRWENMGAPVVDSQGHLVGVFHIGLLGTKMAGILLFKDLNRILEGDIEKIEFGKLFKDHEDFKLEIIAEKFDPFNSMRDFGIAVMPQSKLPHQPRMKNNEYQPIAEPDGYKKFPVTNETKRILIDLGKTKENTVLFAIQLKYTDCHKKIHYSPIIRYQFYARYACVPRKENKPEEVGVPDDLPPGPKAPIPKKVNVNILSKRFNIKDAEIDRLELQNAKILSLFWSQDKKIFYALDDKNILRKISYPECVELARIEFNRKVSSCAMSQCGIAAVCPELKELWVINKDSLAVEKQIKINDGLHVECSPALKIAFVTGKSNPKRHLSIINLEKGKLTSRIDAYTLDPRHFSINFNNFSVSQDGKFLFANSGRSFCSFRIAERYVFGWTTVPYKVTSKSLGHSKIVLSRDNMYFGLPQAGKIFQTSNLNAPLLEINPGKALFFDKEHGRLISACNTDYNVKIYDAKNGKTLKTYCFRDIDKKRKHVNITIEKMLVDPDHDTLIAYSWKSLYKIKLLNVPRGTLNPKNWIGYDKSSPLEEGKVVKRAVPLAGKISSVEDMKIRSFTFKNKLVPRIIYSKDRRFIYVADTKGMIRKISYPSFVQEYIVDLASDLADIKLSKSHLVAISTSKTVYTLSPDNLKVTRVAKLPLGEQKSLVICPASDLAYGGSYHDIFIVDLNTLKIINTITSRQIAKSYGNSVKVHSSVTPSYLTPEFVNMTITPDGKYLLCGRFHIYKFKTVGKTIKYLEVGPSGIGGINISQDNRHVILTYPRSIPEYIDKPSGALSKSALVYKIDELAKPVAYLNTGGAYCSQIIYDSNRNINYILAGRLYSFSKDGYLAKKYNIHLDAIETVSDSSDLLAISEKKLYSISFTDKANTLPAPITVPENKGLQLYKKGSITTDGIQYTLFITPGAWRKIFDVEWIDNGNACLVSGSNKQGSVIYELTFPDLKEKQRLQFKGSVGSKLLTSGEGPLLEVKRNKEYWLLNTGKLSVSAKISNRDNKEIAVSPGLSIAFFIKDSYPSDQITAFDLKNKRVLYEKEFGKLKSTDNGSPLTDVDNIFITPDGKYLICENDQSLHRYTIGKNATLLHDGMLKKEKYSHLLAISHDSRYLVIKKNQFVEIRKVSNFDKIILTLPVNGARSVGFDMKSAKIYVIDGMGKLLVFNSEGNLLKTFRLRISIDKIYVHLGGGGKILGIANTSLYWIKLEI